MLFIIIFFFLVSDKNRNITPNFGGKMIFVRITKIIFRTLEIRSAFSFTENFIPITLNTGSSLFASGAEGIIR